MSNDGQIQSITSAQGISVFEPVPRVVSANVVSAHHVVEIGGVSLGKVNSNTRKEDSKYIQLSRMIFFESSKTVYKSGTFQDTLMLYDSANRSIDSEALYAEYCLKFPVLSAVTTLSAMTISQDDETVKRDALMLAKDVLETWLNYAGRRFRSAMAKMKSYGTTYGTLDHVLAFTHYYGKHTIEKLGGGIWTINKLKNNSCVICAVVELVRPHIDYFISINSGEEGWTIVYGEGMIIPQHFNGMIVERAIPMTGSHAVANAATDFEDIFWFNIDKHEERHFILTQLGDRHPAIWKIDDEGLQQFISSLMADDFRRMISRHILNSFYDDDTFSENTFGTKIYGMSDHVRTVIKTMEREDAIFRAHMIAVKLMRFYLNLPPLVEYIMYNTDLERRDVSRFLETQATCLLNLCMFSVTPDLDERIIQASLFETLISEKTSEALEFNHQADVPGGMRVLKATKFSALEKDQITWEKLHSLCDKESFGDAVRIVIDECSFSAFR